MELLGRHNTFASLRQALNAAPAGMAFYDASERLKIWNQAYAGLMATCGVEPEAGATRHSQIAAAAAAGWFAATEEGTERFLTDLEARARPGPSEFRLPDGRWLRHEAFRTDDGGGVTVLTDVTDHKES